MCWFSHELPIKNIATEDIICYKVFNKNNIIWERIKSLVIKVIPSLYEQYPYIPYNLNPEIIIKYVKESIYGEGWLIHEGYHSYETLDKAKEECCPGFECIIKCIIPKNTEYYINENKCIVSSNIIVTDKVIN